MKSEFAGCNEALYPWFNTRFELAVLGTFGFPVVLLILAVFSAQITAKSALQKCKSWLVSCKTQASKALFESTMDKEAVLVT
eukprot:6488877-Amphidinium_carterae.1